MNPPPKTGSPLRALPVQLIQSTILKTMILPVHGATQPGLPLTKLSLINQEILKLKSGWMPMEPVIPNTHCNFIIHWNLQTRVPFCGMTLTFEKIARKTAVEIAKNPAKDQGIQFYVKASHP